MSRLIITRTITLSWWRGDNGEAPAEKFHGVLDDIGMTHAVEQIAEGYREGQLVSTAAADDDESGSFEGWWTSVESKEVWV
ncbi:hypothetical protein D9M68_887070 [compost metagenome]